jgi:hypothetical protein
MKITEAMPLIGMDQLLSRVTASLSSKEFIQFAATLASFTELRAEIVRGRGPHTRNQMSKIVADDLYTYVHSLHADSADDKLESWLRGLAMASGLRQLGFSDKAMDFAAFVHASCIIATRNAYPRVPGARCCELISLCLAACIPDLYYPVDCYYAHFSDDGAPESELRHGHLHPHTVSAVVRHGKLWLVDFASAQFDLCTAGRSRTSMRPIRFHVFEQTLTRDFGYSLVPVVFSANVRDKDLRHG